MEKTWCHDKMLEYLVEEYLHDRRKRVLQTKAHILGNGGIHPSEIEDPRTGRIGKPDVWALFYEPYPRDEYEPEIGEIVELVGKVVPRLDDEMAEQVQVLSKHVKEGVSRQLIIAVPPAEVAKAQEVLGDVEGFAIVAEGEPALVGFHNQVPLATA